jgi:hypothetical protein
MLTETGNTIPTERQILPERMTATEVSRYVSTLLKKELSSEEMLFVDENIEIVTIGKKKIMFISQEHSQFKKDEGLHPIQQDITCNPQTKLVVLEYFPEELTRVSKEVPFIGDFLQKSFIKNWSKIPEMQFADALSLLCQNNSKTIVSADIAYTPGYALAWVYGQALTMGFAEIQDSLGFGMFGRDVSTIEWIMLHFEDARRLFVAKGLEALAKMPENANDEELIVVNYPKAHASRIVNYLTERNPIKTQIIKAKERMYRTIGPGVSYFMRIWKSSTYNQPQDTESQWVKTAEVPL